MTIQDIIFSPERWRQFWEAFKAEPQQLAGIEELRQAIAQSDPALVTEGASWVRNYHKEQPRPTGVITPSVMQKLTGYAPDKFNQSFCDDFNRLLQDSGFADHPDARNMLIANILHETGNTVYFKEIASGDAYEGRRDLGNTQPGDGPRFKGGGCLQLTGRANYKQLADKLGDPRVMEGVDYVADTYPFRSALPWIEANNLLQVCLTEGFEACCVRINGGHNGYSDRLAKYRVCKVVLG